MKMYFLFLRVIHNKLQSKLCQELEGSAKNFYINFFTHLGGKGRGCADLASDRSQVDVLDLIGIELGTHFSGLEEGGGD